MKGSGKERKRRRKEIERNRIPRHMYFLIVVCNGMLGSGDRKAGLIGSCGQEKELIAERKEIVERESRS